jgi:N-acetylneuraminic acid mutarotase
MKRTITLLLALVFLTALCLVAAELVSSATLLAENSWVSKAPIPVARKSLGVAVVNGKIYAIGGFPDLSNNDEYDPATDTWSSKAAMPTPRYNFAITVYQNKIYCIGGMVSNRSGLGTSFTGAIEVYDPATDSWETKKPMPKPRAQFEANMVNGKIYLAGGRTGGQNSTVSLNEVYDLETESWTTKASMPFPVVEYASAVVENKIYVLGGQDEFNETMNLAVNQIYDTETDTWSFGTPLPTVVWLSAAGATSGVFAPQRIYVTGGQPGNSGDATNIAQVYNPEDDSWSVGASIPTARFDLALAVVNDVFYAIGGTDHYILPGEEANDENEMYMPIGYRTLVEGPEPFPTVPVVVASAAVVVGAGLLVYFKKRKR